MVKGPMTGEPLLTIGDLATLQKIDRLNYDYVDGWLRPKRRSLRDRFWRWVARYADARSSSLRTPLTTEDK